MSDNKRKIMMLTSYIENKRGDDIIPIYSFMTKEMYNFLIIFLKLNTIEYDYWNSKSSAGMSPKIGLELLEKCIEIPLDKYEFLEKNMAEMFSATHNLLAMLSDIYCQDMYSYGNDPDKDKEAIYAKLHSKIVENNLDLAELLRGINGNNLHT